MYPLYHHQKEMKHTMTLASQFSHCYKEGLAKKDQEMMQSEMLKDEE